MCPWWSGRLRPLAAHQQRCRPRSLAPRRLLPAGRRRHAHGRAIGATNRFGEEPADRPVDYKDVFATLYHNMGINIAETPIPDATGRPNYLLPGHEPVAELI